MLRRLNKKNSLPNLKQNIHALFLNTNLGCNKVTGTFKQTTGLERARFSNYMDI